MKAVLAMLPAPVIAASVPLEVSLGIFLVGVVVISVHAVFAEHLRRRRIERDIERWFQNRHRRTYQTRA